MIIIMSGVIFPRHFFAQNLVPNPSFEELDSCPDNQNQLYKAKYWFNPNQFTSPDLFSSCSTNPDISTPNNLFGYQEPKSDSSCTLIAVLYGSNNFGHEYISIRLTDSLLKDSVYCVSFYISPVSDNSTELFTDGIGAYLSGDSVYQTVNTYLDLPAQIRMLGTIFDDTSSWNKIEGFYVAKGGGKFITIGGFWNISELSWKGNSSDAHIVYVDDVSVTKCAPPPDTTANTNFINVYPNPNTGQFSINFGVMEEQNGQFSLWDSSGRLVYKSANLTGKLERDVHLPQLSSGIYMWRFDVNGEKVDTGKLVIRQ